ncbi:hypothetical protein EI555_021499 [Monodon monoceros]|uniref:Cytochrome c oxidase subunit 3 n=1 Tax=Monodon monoceros TaxID=40151 RepID=A0A4V5PA13_MONMO|nr:hypothetical protein EI555_021499 [Monodon monoceros]
MIPLQLNNPTNFKFTNKYSNNMPMMTRYYPRKHFPRPPHTNRPKRTSIWNNLIYPIRKGNRKHILQALFITIMLGLYFTLLQASEYYEAPFTISDAIYGSTFFVATGFHGLHVIIGSTFLILNVYVEKTSPYECGFHPIGVINIPIPPNIRVTLLRRHNTITVQSSSPHNPKLTLHSSQHDTNYLLAFAAVKQLSD